MTASNLVTTFYDEIISEAVKSIPLQEKGDVRLRWIYGCHVCRLQTYIPSSWSSISGNRIRNLELEKHNSQAEFMKFVRVVLGPAERLIATELSRTREKKSLSHLSMSHSF